MPLKSISLDAKQKRAISKLQTRRPQQQEFQLLTSRRFSLVTSLALHLLIGLIATLYVVQFTTSDDDVVIAEILQKSPSKPNRRISSRKVERLKRPRSSQPLPRRLQTPLTTAVQIPTGSARFTLPAGDVSISEDATVSEGTGIGTGALERRLLTGGHQARIASVLPKIKPRRTVDLSIIDSVEMKQMPQSNFNPDPVDPPTVDLRDVTQPPRFLYRSLPKYPELARRAQREGVVVLEASIGIDGIARDIKVLKGLGFGCDRVAIEALKASRFVPAKQGAQVVVVRGIQIPYRFKLED